MQDLPTTLVAREIPDSATVWRRVPFWNMVWDKNLDRARPSSAAFEDDGDGDPMSVAVANFIEEGNGNVHTLIEGHEGFGVVALPVSFLREELSMKVIHTPRPEEPAHASVIGPKTDSTRKKMYKKSTWVVDPTPEQVATLKKRAG